VAPRQSSLYYRRAMAYYKSIANVKEACGGTAMGRFEDIYSSPVKQNHLHLRYSWKKFEKCVSSARRPLRDVMNTTRFRHRRRDAHCIGSYYDLKPFARANTHTHTHTQTHTHTVYLTFRDQSNSGITL